MRPKTVSRILSSACLLFPILQLLVFSQLQSHLLHFEDRLALVFLTFVLSIPALFLLSFFSRSVYLTFVCASPTLLLGTGSLVMMVSLALRMTPSTEEQARRAKENCDHKIALVNLVSSFTSSGFRSFMDEDGRIDPVVLREECEQNSDCKKYAVLPVGISHDLFGSELTFYSDRNEDSVILQAGPSHLAPIAYGPEYPNVDYRFLIFHAPAFYAHSEEIIPPQLISADSCDPFVYGPLLPRTIPVPNARARFPTSRRKEEQALSPYRRSGTSAGNVKGIDYLRSLLTQADKHHVNENVISEFGHQGAAAQGEINVLIPYLREGSRSQLIAALKAIQEIKVVTPEIEKELLDLLLERLGSDFELEREYLRTVEVICPPPQTVAEAMISKFQDSTVQSRQTEFSIAILKSLGPKDERFQKFLSSAWESLHLKVGIEEFALLYNTYLTEWPRCAPKSSEEEQVQ